MYYLSFSCELLSPAFDEDVLGSSAATRALSSALYDEGASSVENNRLKSANTFWTSIRTLAAFIFPSSSIAPSSLLPASVNFSTVLIESPGMKRNFEGLMSANFKKKLEND